MKYIYAALLLDAWDKPITVDAVANIINEFAQPDMNQVKALVESLKGINIKETLNKAALQSTVAVSQPEPKQAPTEPEPKSPKKDKDQSLTGLSDLFGGL